MQQNNNMIYVDKHSVLWEVASLTQYLMVNRNKVTSNFINQKIKIHAKYPDIVMQKNFNMIYIGYNCLLWEVTSLTNYLLVKWHTNFNNHMIKTQAKYHDVRWRKHQFDWYRQKLCTIGSDLPDAIFGGQSAPCHKKIW